MTTTAKRPAATSTAITHIGSLVTNDPSLGDGAPLGLIPDAAVVIDGDRVAWVGAASDAPATDDRRRRRRPRACCPASSTPTPTWSSPATAPPEFDARMSGRPYSAGGIRTTVAATRAATDEALAANVARYLARGAAPGHHHHGDQVRATASPSSDEARSLRIAAAHTDEVTFLGAHVVPPEYADDPAGYVALVTGPMLDACAPHARWVDVVLRAGAFDGDQARAVLTAGEGPRA